MSLPSRAAASLIRLSTSLGLDPDLDADPRVPELLYRRLHGASDLRGRHRPPARPCGARRGERLEAWALTGPPGRVWSFAADVAAAVPMLVRYWARRACGAGARRRTDP